MTNYLCCEKLFNGHNNYEYCFETDQTWLKPRKLCNKFYTAVSYYPKRQENKLTWNYTEELEHFANNAVGALAMCNLSSTSEGKTK